MTNRGESEDWTPLASGQISGQSIDALPGRGWISWLVLLISLPPSLLAKWLRRGRLDPITSALLAWESRFVYGDRSG